MPFFRCGTDMAKEEKPPEYERRIRDTKGVAQRLDLGYLGRTAALLLFRRKLTWSVLALAAAFAVPLILQIGWSRRSLSAGPVSSAHAIFEGRCQDCHSQAFRRVPDVACLKCHDGPAHPAKSVDTARIAALPPCYGCHVEHRGEIELAKVSDGNCTACHANLTAHAQGVKLQALSITAFRPGRHPEFAAALLPDLRPIKLNHAAHMPATPKTIRGIHLPMRCQDCHATDSASPKGNLQPVTFEGQCRTCHARELEFDVYQLLGPAAVPSPHTKDPQTIHQFIAATYSRLLQSDPALASRPLGNELTPPPNAAAWLNRVTKDSEQFLFQRKCSYCHEYQGFDQGFPIVRKVNRIYGRYVEGQPGGSPWLMRGEFSHRAHRAVECESCHTAARASTQTSDVLIPVMKSCLPCHQDSRAGLNRCSECHLYHNKSLEKDRDRRPAGQVFTAGSAIHRDEVPSQIGGPF
jgi:hypothetical protein